MSHYWKKCPHCRNTVEHGHGLPLTEFGDPKKRCRYCFRTYIDRNVIDWETASLFKKFMFCLANGRVFLCFITYVIAIARVNLKVEWDNWQIYLACFPFFLIAFGLCVLYVKIKVRLYYGKSEKKAKKELSKDRYKKYKDGMFSQTSSSKKEK